MNNYSGYVYIWYDTKAKLFYIGSHLGKIDDSYICSSKTMLKAYNIRPDTFKFKILQYVQGTIQDIQTSEQYWLDKIKDTELLLTENVKNKTARYYNVKKIARGGSHKGHTKIRTKPAWNKGISMIPWNKGKNHNSDERIKLTSKKWRNFSCPVCSTPIITKKPNQKTCSYKCSTTLVWQSRKSDDVSVPKYII